MNSTDFRGHEFDAHRGFEAWIPIAFELAEFELANPGKASCHDTC